MAVAFDHFWRRTCLVRAIAWTTVGCALSLWSLALPTSAETVELKVMSFNVLHSLDAADDGLPENRWDDQAHPRRERAVRVVRQYAPDLLGVQEPRRHQLADFETALPEMAYYGVGRDDGRSAGEYAAIFYRKNRFERTGQGSFWLSESPEKPGTSFYTGEDSVPRIASWVVLRDRVTGQRLFVLNTHWEWQDAAARLKSARLIRQRLASLADGLPTVLLGDYNSPEDSAEQKMLRGVDPPANPRLMDSYREVHPEVKPDERTIHLFEPSLLGSRIDFILHTDELRASAAAIVRTTYDGLWPSDHYPVTATLWFKTEP